MWWFIPTAVASILCLPIALVVRRLWIAGSVGGVLPPWLLLPMAVLAIMGPPWILWLLETRPGAGATNGHFMLLSVLTLLLLPATILLSFIWLLARQPDHEDLCPSCGHRLLTDQRTCPECGGARHVPTLRRLSSAFVRGRSTYPLAFALATGFQALLALTAFVVGALLLIPTPRLVVNQRLNGTSSGTVFSPGGPDGIDYPFQLTCVVKSSVKTAASFAAPLPYLPSEVALDVDVQGSIGQERNGQTLGEAKPIAISTRVSSLSEAEALVSSMTCQRFGVPVAAARDPLVSDAALVRMTASGYWPLTAPTGAAPAATMAAADRWLALGEITSPWITFGVPCAIGAIAFLIARPRSAASKPTVA